MKSNATEKQQSIFSLGILSRYVLYLIMVKKDHYNYMNIYAPTIYVVFIYLYDIYSGSWYIQVCTLNVWSVIVVYKCI